MLSQKQTVERAEKGAFFTKFLCKAKPNQQISWRLRTAREGSCSTSTPTSPKRSPIPIPNKPRWPKCRLTASATEPTERRLPPGYKSLHRIPPTAPAVLPPKWTPAEPHRRPKTASSTRAVAGGHAMNSFLQGSVSYLSPF